MNETQPTNNEHDLGTCGRHTVLGASCAACLAMSGLHLLKHCLPQPTHLGYHQLCPQPWVIFTLLLLPWQAALCWAGIICGLSGSHLFCSHLPAQSFVFCRTFSRRKDHRKVALRCWQCSWSWPPHAPQSWHHSF